MAKYISALAVIMMFMRMFQLQKFFNSVYNALIFIISIEKLYKHICTRGSLLGPNLSRGKMAIFVTFFARR
jgi:hypothetical protein